jgi:hypothetical protein
MGGKKRKSTNNASSQNVASIKQSLSGEDSDYGVLSDPDEGIEYNRPIEEPSSPVVIPEGVSIDTKDIMINEIKCEEETTKINMVDTDNKHATTTTTTEASNEVITQPTNNNSESAPAKEAPESVFDKSLEHLKIKLEKDTEFSEKMVHTTFLSFVILAMEIDDRVTNSFSRISSAEAYETHNVERLIDYMIKTRSATPEVEKYAQAIMQLGVVTHIIKGLIEFNLSLLDKNEKNPSIIRPYLKELERLNKEKRTENTKKQSPSAEADTADAKPNKFIQFWRNITCCCRCKRSRKNSILESVDTESKEMKDTTMSNENDNALTPL